MELPDNEIRAATQRAMGDAPDWIESLKGRAGTAYRMSVAGRPVIAMKRRDAQRTETEASVLAALYQRNAAVPEFLGRDGAWIFQGALSGTPLSRALWLASNEAAEKALLQRALDSLAKIHAAGRSAGLPGQIPEIGQTLAWRARLASLPARLGAMTGLPAPATNSDSVATRLVPVRNSFLKWDARPANAMVRPDGAVAWFDWEHCGARDVLDDAAWLLGDEMTPARAALAVDPAFLLPDDDTRGPDEAQADFHCFAALHACVRLALIAEQYQHHRGWLDWQNCLEHDTIGVTAACWQGTLDKAIHWAAASDELRPLTPWFADLKEGWPHD